MQLILLFFLCVVPSLCDVVVDTHEVLPSGHGFAGEAKWYLFQYGPNYSAHRKPYRIYTKQCNEFVAVSWTSVEWSTQKMTGHVTLLKTTSEQGKHTIVDNREFSEIETMHDLAWNDDCSALYVLGKTPLERAFSVPTSHNLISTYPGIESNNFLNPKYSFGHKNIYLYIFTVTTQLSSSPEIYLIALNGGGSQYGNHLIDIYTPEGGEPTLFFYTKGEQCRVRPVRHKDIKQGRDIGIGRISVSEITDEITGTDTEFMKQLDKDAPIEFWADGDRYIATIEKVISDTRAQLRYVERDDGDDDDEIVEVDADEWKMTGFRDCHQGDTTYQIYLRDPLTYNNDQRDGWTIGGGHMHTNKISKNSHSHKMIQAAAGDTDKIFFRVSSSLVGFNPAADFNVPFNRRKAIKMNGGLGGITAYGDGWVATIINEASANNKQTGDGIGIIKINNDGQKIGNIKWIKPQSNTKPVAVNIGTLPNGRLLLGWGSTGCDSSCSSDSHQLTPTQFYLSELDYDTLNIVTDIEAVGDEVGWGEVDAWDSGPNSVVWSYTYVNKPTHPDNTGYADSQQKISTKLRIFTYSSASSPSPPVDTVCGTEDEQCEKGSYACGDDCLCIEGARHYASGSTKMCWIPRPRPTGADREKLQGSGTPRGGAANSAEDRRDAEEELEEIRQELKEDYDDDDMPGYAIGLVVLTVIVVVQLIALVFIQLLK